MTTALGWGGIVFFGLVVTAVFGAWLSKQLKPKVKNSTPTLTPGFYVECGECKIKMTYYEPDGCWVCSKCLKKMQVKQDEISFEDGRKL